MRGRERLRRLAGWVPVTPLGGLLLATTVAAGAVVGLGRRDVVFLTVALSALALGLLLLVPVASAALAVRRGLPRGPLRAVVLEAGVLQPTGFSVPLPWLLPLVELGWTWEAPRGVAVVVERRRGAADEVVRPSRRGVHRQVVRRLDVRDALGLTGLAFTRSEESDVRVLPARGALDQRLLLEALAGGEEHADPHGDPAGDYVEMRRYAPGDSPRLILWKAYARTRKLLVRVPEKAVAAHPRSCAYLVAGDGDEASAALSRVLVERDALGPGWRLGADGTAGFASAKDDALERIARSGNAVPGETGLGSFLDEAQRDGYGSCLVLVPARPGAWVEPVLRALASASLHLRLLTAVDGDAAAGAEGSRLARLLVLPAPDEGVPPAGLRLLADRLRGLDVPLVAVDRSTGSVLGDPRGAS